MELSEAIRLGSLLFPQGFNGSMNGETRCALAAAAEACGSGSIFSLYYQDHIIDGVALSKRFPILNQYVANPVDGVIFPLQMVIVQLNDRRLWSRERIADWVASLEQQRVAPAEMRTPIGVVA